MIYPSQASSRKWRVLDITVTSVIAVASGVVFWMWDWVCMAPLTLFENITPGFEGLLNGFWLFAGPLAAVIVRKPGAALYAETVAAFLELTLGNQWGVGGSLIVGLLQGLGAELAFALFAYKVWTNLVVLLSGALSGAMCGVYYWFTNPGWGMMRASIYLGTSVMGGVIAAAACISLSRAIARTGALAQFAHWRVRDSGTERA